jgi:hypothetical protein
VKTYLVLVGVLVGCGPAVIPGGNVLAEAEVDCNSVGCYIPSGQGFHATGVLGISDNVVSIALDEDVPAGAALVISPSLALRGEGQLTQSGVQVEFWLLDSDVETAPVPPVNLSFEFQVITH